MGVILWCGRRNELPMADLPNQAEEIESVKAAIIAFAHHQVLLYKPPLYVHKKEPNARVLDC